MCLSRCAKEKGEQVEESNREQESHQKHEIEKVLIKNKPTESVRKERINVVMNMMIMTKVLKMRMRRNG